MTTPVALITGWSDGRKTSRRTAAASPSIRAVAASDVVTAASPLSIAPRTAAAAARDPDLHEALFGERPRPFSITLVFPPLEVPAFDAALAIARGSAEFHETGSGAARRYRARFWSSDAAKLKDLFQIVGASDETDVLIDDRPVPYARELWLPLVWFLIPR